jgi:hypothetical protein
MLKKIIQTRSDAKCPICQGSQGSIMSCSCELSVAPEAQLPCCLAMHSEIGRRLTESEESFLKAKAWEDPILHNSCLGWACCSCHRTSRNVIRHVKICSVQDPSERMHSTPQRSTLIALKKEQRGERFSLQHQPSSLLAFSLVRPAVAWCCSAPHAHRAWHEHLRTPAYPSRSPTEVHPANMQHHHGEISIRNSPAALSIRFAMSALIETSRLEGRYPHASISLLTAILCSSLVQPHHDPRDRPSRTALPTSSTIPTISSGSGPFAISLIFSSRSSYVDALRMIPSLSPSSE